METIENKIEYTYSAEELNQKLKQFINNVENLIKENNYSLNVKSKVAFKEYKNIDWTSYFNKMSKNMRKKTNKYLRRFELKNNRHSANLFLHFIHTRILSERDVQSYGYYDFEVFKQPQWVDKVKISKSAKEQSIENKRKKWLELRDMAILALNEYKEIKGDFYKKKNK